MDKKQLMKNLEKLGFPLFGLEEYMDVNSTLAEVVRSRDARLWEGFPVLLKNSLEQEGFNVETVEAYLESDERECFWQLSCMSAALYQEFSLSYSFRVLDSSDKLREEVERWRNEFVHGRAMSGGDVSVGNVRLSLDRVKRLFQDYYLSEQAEAEKRRRAAQEEFSLEYALSQVFSPKQKELFRKKLAGKPLTKTEREYYSRVVKKKVMALANEELYRLARLARES